MAEELDSGAYSIMAEAAAGLRNPEIDRWKAGGGKVLGYFCAMLPEELFMAAGLLPFRMRATGSPGTDSADSYFTNNNCTFVRHCFSLALQGGFDWLDGVVVINSCDQIRRLYDNWKLKIDSPFLELVVMPHDTGPNQVNWFHEEFQQLRGRIEEHFGATITDGAIREAISVTNETRRLQRQLYDLRKRDRPALTGEETLTAMVASTALPKPRYNELLGELLEDVRERELEGDYRARMMVTGGILDDPSWVAAVESTGALVVTDGTCFGGRLIACDPDEAADDPLKALARYYLVERPSCPRMMGTHVKRADFTIDLAREFNCDGIIGEKMMFCDQWQVEQMMLTMDLTEADIPFLKLEREYVTSGTGQLQTRVQAFMESMGR